MSKQIRVSDEAYELLAAEAAKTHRSRIADMVDALVLPPRLKSFDQTVGTTHAAETMAKMKPGDVPPSMRDVDYGTLHSREQVDRAKADFESRTWQSKFEAEED